MHVAAEEITTAAVASDFLRRIFAPDDAAIDRLKNALPVLDPVAVVWAKGQGAQPFNVAADPGDALREAGLYATSLSADGHEVYFGACLLNGRVVGGKHRGRKADAVAMGGVWLDLDYAAPYRGKRKAGALPLPPDLDSLCDLLLSVALPPPTLMVATGAGIQPWWLFRNRPVGLSGPEAQRAAHELVAGLQRHIREAAAARGWHVDSTADLTRVLRLPGTHNLKGEEAKLVQYLPYDGPETSWEEVAAAVGAATMPSNASIPGYWGSAKPVGLVDAAEAPEKPASPLRAGETLVDRVRARMIRARNQEMLGDAKKLVAGEAFPPGERNVKFQRLTSAAAWYAVQAKPDVSSDDLWPIFAASEAAMAHEAASDPDAASNPPPDEFKIRDMLERNILDASDKQSAARRRLEKGRAALARVAMRIGGSLDFRAAVAERSDVQLEYGYSDEDVEKFADDQGCTVDDFKKRLVVQLGGSCWIWSNGRYLSSVPPADVEGAVEQWLSPVPWLDWYYENDKGEQKRKKLSDFMRECRTIALRSEADLTLSRSVFDGDTFTFREAVCPPRELEPRFDKDIDRWLRLLGDDLQELLLDWIACVTRLDRQCCAIYLNGLPGIGKTLLPNGLARIWSTAGPSDLERVLGNFNETLARCPLVFADEELPQVFQGSVSAKIRALIGSSDRWLNRKHKPGQMIVGALRLIFSANNDQLLVDPFRDYTPADIRAVAERVLFIDAGENSAARDFLDELGGPPATEPWVKDDLIARHALWLRDNRVVESAKRFLVTGTLTRMHRLLATGHGEAARVSDWLAHLLVAPNQVLRLFANGSREALIGNGHLLVTTNAVMQGWTHYVKYGRLPTTTSIGRALANLSLGNARVRGLDAARGVRYHDIDLANIYSWANRVGFGDPDEMAARVAAPDPQWAGTVERIQKQK